MNRLEYLEKLISEKEAELKPLKKEWNKLILEEADKIEDRIHNCHFLKDKFKQDELRYSRITRCACGKGLAYVKNCSPRSAWYCSAILTGTADQNVKHDKGFPFDSYEIKSENEQQTTRE